MHYFAKNTPSAFAQYGISLIMNGWGQFHGLRVEAKTDAVWCGSVWEKHKTETLAKKDVLGQPQQPLAEADFVTMVSFDVGLFGSPRRASPPR